MMKETGTNSKKFIWRQRIGFGISDYACNLAYLMVNTYLLIFYTDVAGIPAASAAFMFLITKFIDAFTDYRHLYVALTRGSRDIIVIKLVPPEERQGNLF